MKRILSFLLLSAMLLSLAACGGQAKEQRRMREFTDDLGRTVAVPEVIQRVAVSGPMAQLIVFSIAPDQLIGISNAWNPGTEELLEERYLKLPVLGQLYGGKGAVNLEELLKHQPDIVIDIGEAKDGAAEDMDTLTEQSGIPFVHFNARTETMPECYAAVGALLGMEEAGTQLGEYCRTVYESSKRLVECAAAEQRKPTLLYLLGDEGLNVIAKGSYHAETIDMMAENVAVVENPTVKGTGNETDMEQLLLWDPEVILFAPGSVYDKVGTDDRWRQLRAIREGKYYQVPFGPYNWIGFPPSVQRYLGMLWLGELLYPEYTEYALFTEVCRYFKLFYHCELSREQYDALMKNSL